MAHLILIRHGEPDYQFVTVRNFIGHGRDLAPLTENGLNQANKVSHDERLQNSEFIISSPYTRALQTAAIISKNTGLDIKIETDLHEWLPDLTFQFDSDTYVVNASKECTVFKGIHNKAAQFNWESLSDVAKRAFNCLYKYVENKKIIIVTHGIVMRQFVYADHIPYCGILETDFNRNFVWQGFNDKA